uniref:NADH dehydrogenase subunit 4L n=1 Tax=Ashinkailepas seepiophila TaxID=479252 RepID=UPI0021CC98A3|nr:NADH dehydrogenase subunit 4L [Ashinkailepas seepiophila]UWM12891.1 NADH dehydrogenase subunit 4L [Ashinkailepas seepiophila]
MLSNFLYLPVFLFLVGFWMYISKRAHLMSMLISLEYVVLSIFFFLILISIVMGFEVYLSLVFLVASVCEGSLGVSILVGMVRSHSSDYLSVLSVLKC